MTKSECEAGIGGECTCDVTRSELFAELEAALDELVTAVEATAHQQGE